MTSEDVERTRARTRATRARSHSLGTIVEFRGRVVANERDGEGVKEKKRSEGEDEDERRDDGERRRERDGKVNASAGTGARARDDERANANAEVAERFECNVCFEIAREPAVTPCGHLYCWKCINRWLEGGKDDGGAACPVCKARVCEGDLIPLYGLGTEASSPERRRAMRSGEEDSNVVADQSRGLAALLGFRCRDGDEATSGQANQLWLSRVLLMIGTFAIVCLLII